MGKPRTSAHALTPEQRIGLRGFDADLLEEVERLGVVTEREFRRWSVREDQRTRAWWWLTTCDLQLLEPVDQDGPDELMRLSDSGRAELDRIRRPTLAGRIQVGLALLPVLVAVAALAVSILAHSDRISAWHRILIPVLVGVVPVTLLGQMLRDGWQTRRARKTNARRVGDLPVPVVLPWPTTSAVVGRSSAAR